MAGWRRRRLRRVTGTSLRAAVSSLDVVRIESPARGHREPDSADPPLYLSDYLAGAPGEPSAVLVEDEGVIRPHFHRVDQFQILVAGRAQFGKHEVEPVAVHYTDGYTPYGPLRPL